MRLTCLPLLALAAASCSAPEAKPGGAQAAAPSLHQRLLTLDTHLDTPTFFANPNWKFGDRHDWRTDLAQVDLGRMETGALDGGVRMAGPVHSKDNQFADSATGTGTWKGLSPLGRKWVAEMNRLGMVIDGSHSSDATFDQMLELSKAPIILSHSGPKAMWDHNRNIDDDRIRRLAAKGGAVCMNSVFLTKMNYTAERNRLSDLADDIGKLSPAEQAKLIADIRKLDETAPVQDTDFENFMRNLLYLLKIAGPDHVCMGADWDGGGGVRGFEDITALPKVTERLLAAGYSEKDIAKIWSGNVLRILRAADAAKGK